jgi:hypothetical protein
MEENATTHEDTLFKICYFPTQNLDRSQMQRVRHLGIRRRKAIIEEENVARDAARAYSVHDLRPLGQLLGRIARLVQRLGRPVQSHVRKRGSGRHVRVEVRVLMNDIGPIARAQKGKHCVAQPRFVAKVKRKSQIGRNLARKRLEFFCKRERQEK